MRELITKIIMDGIRAPSGENCQPWKFSVNGNSISVYNIPERDDSLYSWGQRASIIAHGALIENMTISAQTLGASVTSVRLFPDPADPTLISTMTFEPAPPHPHRLYPSIARRASNRKPYKKTALTAEEIRTLLDTNRSGGTARFVMVTDPQKNKAIGAIGGINEKILFGNKFLHKFFFNHITWTKEENATKSLGFYLPTLELPPPATVLFPLIKHWNILSVFNMFGFAGLIGAGNGQLYGSSPAFGAIVIPSTSTEDFLAAGRLLQQVWLTITDIGLSMQPLTGVIFLNLRMTHGEHDQLSVKHRELVRTSYQHLQTHFDVRPSDTIAMVFRMGHADPPSAVSSRLQPHITFS